MDYTSSPKKEIALKGIPASPGIAIGKVYLYAKEIPRIEQWRVTDKEYLREIERLDRALEKSVKELQKILLPRRSRWMRPRASASDSSSASSAPARPSLPNFPGLTKTNPRAVRALALTRAPARAGPAASPPDIAAGRARRRGH